MGIGREVADAYIQVHGDLTKFRKSLSGAAKEGRAVGMDAADSFSAGWDKRTEANFTKKWEGIMDSLHSNKKVDWNRLVGTFDAKGFADAKARINKFLSDAKKNEIITEKEYQKARKAIKGTMDLMDAEHKLTLKQAEEKKKLREREIAFREATKQAIKDARIEQERYNRSFAGMFENNRLHELEKDFRAITAAMADGDWSKFSKGEEHLFQVSKRIKENVIHMKGLGRVTDEEGDRIIAAARGHVEAELARRNALALTAEQTRKNTEEQERYKRSFEGMFEGAKLKEMEDRYKAIARAMATTNWGPLARDHESVKTFRREIMQTADEMRSAGRISEESYNRIGDSVRTAVRNQDDHNISLRRTSANFAGLGKVFDKLKGSWQNMDKTVRLVLTLIAAAAGPIATLGSGLTAALSGLVSSLGMAMGAIVPLAAGALAFVGAIALAVSSLDDVRARLPGIDEAMRGIGATWKHQAGEFGKEWGESLEGLLSSFNDKLARTDFGTPFGKAAREITNAFTDVVNSPGFDALLRAMETDLPAAVSGLGRGIAGLMGGLSSLFAGAAPAAKALGEDFAGWGAKIAASLEQARESGKLNEVFMKSREALLAVLDAVGSVGSALGTMFMIGSESGNSMLESITRVADKFNEWMHTEDGRNSMMEWFENGERILRSLEPVAVGLATALNGLVTDYSISQFENLMGSVGEILPVLGDLLGVVSDLGIMNLLADAIRLVGEFLTPLIPPLRDLARELGPALQEVMTALAPSFAELGEALVPVIETLAELAIELLPQLVPHLVDLAEELPPMISALGDLLQMVLDLVAPGAITKLAGDMTGLAEDVAVAAALINDALEIVTALLTGDWATAWTETKDLLANFANETVENFEEAFGPLIESFTLFTEEAGTQLGIWKEDAATKFQEVKDNIGSFVEDGQTNLGLWGDFLEEKLVTKANETMTRAKEGWAGLKEDVSARAGEMSENLNGNLDRMWEKFDEVFPGTRQIATDEFNWMKDAVTEGAGVMADNLASNWDGIYTKATETAGNMKDEAVTQYNTLKDGVTETLGTIADDNARYWGEVADKAGENIDGMKQGVSRNYGEMEKDVKVYGNLISEASKQTWEKAKRWSEENIAPMVRNAQNSFTDIKNSVSNRLGEARDSAGRTMGEMRDRASRTWDDMVRNGGNLMNRLGETIRRGAQIVIEFFLQLPRRMVEAIQNPDLLWSAGNSIMGGLINGLQARYQELKNFVGGIASWIADHKGPISYDRVLLTPAGNAIMDGLIGGLKARMPDLERSVRSITQTLAGAVDADAVDAAATGARSVITALAAEFDSSKTYVFGLDAAAGLADGLAKGAALVKGAYGDLSAPAPGAFTYRPTPAGSSGAEAAEGKSVVVEAGAIQLSSNVSDPELAANKLLDAIVNHLP